MSILQTVQQPADVPGAAPEPQLGGARRLPLPALFLGRALATLCSNAKARAGLVLLAAIVLGERIDTGQRMGIGICTLAVATLALA